MKNICSEVKVENPYFKLKVGTIDKKHPNTFYIEGSTFITPVEQDEMTYKEKFKRVYKEIWRGIDEMRVKKRNAIKKTYIINIDVADERIKPEKKTYFTFQYFLQQDGEIVPFQEIINNIDDYTKTVLDRLEYSLKDNGFALSKNKN